jgi:hypothetical protein
VIRAAIVAIALAHSAAAVGQPLYCSTWQGFTTCSSPGGYTSTEWDRDGMRFGQDSEGNRWTTSRWQGIETTTGRRPER